MRDGSHGSGRQRPPLLLELRNLRQEPFVVVTPVHHDDMSLQSGHLLLSLLQISLQPLCPVFQYFEGDVLHIVVLQHHHVLCGIDLLSQVVHVLRQLLILLVKEVLI